MSLINAKRLITSSPGPFWNIAYILTNNKQILSYESISWNPSWCRPVILTMRIWYQRLVMHHYTLFNGTLTAGWNMRASIYERVLSVIIILYVIQSLPTCQTVGLERKPALAEHGSIVGTTTFTLWSRRCWYIRFAFYSEPGWHNNGFISSIIVSITCQLWLCLKHESLIYITWYIWQLQMLSNVNKQYLLSLN